MILKCSKTNFHVTIYNNYYKEQIKYNKRPNHIQLHILQNGYDSYNLM